MKKHFLIAQTLLWLILPQAHAFADDDARRAILDLRVQLQQASENRIDMMNRIQKLEETVSRLQDQLLSENSNSHLNLGSEVPQVGDIKEQNDYNQAYNIYTHGDYPQSAQAFLEFSEHYPNSALRNHAVFFYGSSLYANKQYKEAINTLENLIVSYPNFSKNPDALLVIFASNQKLNQLKQAKATLNRIINQYPDSQAAQVARKYIQKIR